MAQAIYVWRNHWPYFRPTVWWLWACRSFSWPYIFYINIPWGIIAALLTLQYVARSPKYAEKRPASEVDWLGFFLLMVAGLFAIHFGKRPGR